MLISYNRPPSIAWSLIGAGAAWLTDADVMTNGRPAASARLQWLSGAQTTASVLTLRGTWSTALVPRVVALLGLTLPVGTLITLAFRRPADAGYTYLADVASQRVVQLPDGSRCAWFVLADGLDPVIGVEYRIHNDVDGAASIVADSTFDAGEAWVGPAVEIKHEADWRDWSTDPSINRRSLGSQLFTTQRLGYRSLQLTFVRGKLPVVRGGGLANGMDWQLLRGTLAASTRAAIVPRFDTATEIHRTAIFGAVKPGDITHLAGPDYGSGLEIDEVPAAPPA